MRAPATSSVNKEVVVAAAEVPVAEAPNGPSAIGLTYPVSGTFAYPFIVVGAAASSRPEAKVTFAAVAVIPALGVAATHTGSAVVVPATGNTPMIAFVMTAALVFPAGLNMPIMVVEVAARGAVKVALAMLKPAAVVEAMNRRPLRHASK